MVTPTQYRYKVIWSEEDQEFVGVCDEFPSLSHLDKDRDAVLSGIKNLVEDCNSNDDVIVDVYLKNGGTHQVRLVDAQDYIEQNKDKVIKKYQPARRSMYQ